MEEHDIRLLLSELLEAQQIIMNHADFANRLEQDSEFDVAGAEAISKHSLDSFVEVMRKLHVSIGILEKKVSKESMIDAQFDLDGDESGSKIVH